jgi:response regulator RpfG family c-di-GMP phosphodiesterase
MAPHPPGLSIRRGRIGPELERGASMTVAVLLLLVFFAVEMGYVNRALAFLVIGVLVGGYIDRRRRIATGLGRPPMEGPGLPPTNVSEDVTAEIDALVDGFRKGAIRGVARDVPANRRAELGLGNDARRLESTLTERTRDLIEARAETLQLLAVAAEYRDDETPQHTERLGCLAAEIAGGLGLSEESVALLREAAPLHDIGKLAIPDSVLLKRTALSPSEQAVFETHTTLGARLLFGSRSPVLQLAGVIAETHHERWDGTGYPRGLVGEAIPLVGRIVAVADVFDALTHTSQGASTSPDERAVRLVRRAAGTQFDPRIVTTFLAVREGTVTPTQASAFAEALGQ